MAEAKAAIGVLCKHLNLLFNIEIKPEHFRLAKFNKTEDNVVPIFWNLLTKFPSEIVTSNVVRNTKLHLAKLKYECLEFFGVPETMSQGSRELLLALGYLISVGGLNDIVKEEVKKTPFNPESISYGHGATSIEVLTPQDFQIKNESDRKNAIMWIEGKIKQNERVCCDLKCQVENLKRKIAENIPPIKKELSMGEILALTKGECGAKFLYDTERIMNVLRNHENWLKNERVFWDWMGSVLIERDRSPSEISIADLESFLALAKR